MMDVAASFPQRVAACPDTTFAILTKYTNIKSYYSSLPVTFNPVTYENAQLYTLGLLDDYMGYKVHLKTVREMRLAPVEWEQNTEDGDDESFDTTPADLDYARREILLNMLLIVDRVDKIEGRPDLATMFILGADATDYRPDEKDLVGPEDPAVFAMRLPIRAASRITAPPTKLTQEQLEKLKTFEELFPSPITQLKAKEYKEVVSCSNMLLYIRPMTQVKLDQDPTLTNPLAYNYVVLHTTRRWVIPTIMPCT